MSSASAWASSTAAQRAFTAGHHRRARLLGHGPRLSLVAHQPDGLGRRSDEGDAAGTADLGEGRILREQTVAGVDGLAIGDRGRRDDARDIEVALARLGWPVQMVSSASRTGSEPESAVEWAITARMPISRHVRRTRSAISPRLAIRIL